MTGPRRKKDRDPHLSPIDIMAPHDRDVRRILTSEGMTALEIITELYEEKRLGGPPPYLCFRQGADDRQEMITARHTWTHDSESMKVPKGDLTDPYASAEALQAFDEYCRRLLLRLHAKFDPASILFVTVFNAYLDAIDPAKNIPGNVELKLVAKKSLGTRDPDDTFKATRNKAKKILGFVKDKPLGWLKDGFGKNYMRHARKEYGAADSSIGGQLSFVNLAFDWFGREFRPPFKFAFTMPDLERAEPSDLTWAEVARTLLHCLGYVWRDGGFATRWTAIDGEWHLEFERNLYAVTRGNRKVDFVLLYAPVIRLILIYWLTGTRKSALLGLGYQPMNRRGWISLGETFIYRNGRKDPNYLNKPREKSPLLPCVNELFHRFYQQDLQASAAQRWSHRVDGSAYVVHNGRGARAQNVSKLAYKALDAVGLEEATIHDHKGGGVTAYWHAGFPLEHIAFRFGNTEGSLDKAYRNFKNAEKGVERKVANPETITLDQLINPHGLPFSMPRTDPPPPPVGAIAAEPDRIIRHELELAIRKVLYGPETKAEKTRPAHRTSGSVARRHSDAGLRRRRHDAAAIDVRTVPRAGN